MGAMRWRDWLVEYPARAWSFIADAYFRLLILAVISLGFTLIVGFALELCGHPMP